tara:strand:- start:3269 stop:8107 length:4839 start_codon:yes stop_codon:yes gene_type:complete
MIDLSQKPKIRQDLENKTVEFTTLIVIDPENNPLYIGQRKELFDNDKFFEDRNLKITSIKESINTRSKNFSINNVSFSLSNYTIGNERFSDFVSENGLENKYIEIYYKTPSCTLLDDCLMIFRGTIRRITHDSKIVKIQLEDLTQDKLSKTVPIANIASSIHAYNKDYINRPIPILYGKVDKAPAIPWINKSNPNDEVSVRIICDDLLDDSRNIIIGDLYSEETTSAYQNETGGVNPLYIDKGDYYQVLQNFNPNVLVGGDGDVQDWSWIDNEQYTISSNKVIEIRKKFSGVIPKNPPAFNEFQCLKVRFPSQCVIMGNPEGESIYDGTTSVFHSQETIGRPQLSIDDPKGLRLTSNLNEDLLGNLSYWDSSAVIPNDTIMGTFTGQRVIEYWSPSIVSNTYNYKGTHFPFESEHSRLEHPNYATYQSRVLAWLDSGMGALNTDAFSINDATHQFESDPTVVYKQLPTLAMVRDAVNKKIHEQIYDSVIAKFQHEEALNNVGFVREWNGQSYIMTIGMDKPAVVPYHLLAKEYQPWMYDFGNGNDNLDLFQSVFNFQAGIGGSNGGNNILVQKFEEDIEGQHFNGFGQDVCFMPSTGTGTYYNYTFDKYAEDHHQNGGTYTMGDAIGVTSWGSQLYGNDDVHFADNIYSGQRWWNNLNEGAPLPQPVVYVFEVELAFRGDDPHLYGIGLGADTLALEEYLDEDDFIAWLEANASPFADLFTTEFIGWNSFNGDLVYVSLENGSFNPDDLPLGDVYSKKEEIRRAKFQNQSDTLTWQYSFGSYTGNVKYFNLFDLEDNNHEGLFNPDEFAELAPIEAYQQGRHEDQHAMYSSYRCLWNGVESYTEDLQTPESGYPTNYHSPTMSTVYEYNDEYTYKRGETQGWYAGYGYAGYITETVGNNDYWWDYIRNEMYTHQHTMHPCSTPEQSWVIWVKKDIQGLGEPLVPNTDVMQLYDDWGSLGVNTNAVITKNSLYPVSHIGRYDPDPSSSDDRKHEYTFISSPQTPVNSSLQELDSGSNNFTIHDGEGLTSAKRVSILFPFNDLEISDNIKTETFLNGKVNCYFDSVFSTDTSNSSFSLSVGAVDTESIDPNGEFITFDWASYDQAGTVLIEKDLDECIDNTQFNWSSSLEDISDDNNTYNNMPRFSQFWEVNNFNSMTLTYQVKKGDSGSIDDIGSMYSKIYNMSLIHFVHFEAALDSDFYVDAIGRGSLENPIDIISDFIQAELGFPSSIMGNFSEATPVVSAYKFGFSIKEEVNAKDLISNISKSTPLLPTFKATSSFNYACIKNEYNSGDVDFSINPKDVLKYTITRTPMDDVKTLVNVRYKLDYRTGEYARNTGYIDGYDVFGNGDGTNIAEGRQNGYSYAYMGLERDEKVLEYESAFIRDEATALQLRNFLYSYNCNQHNIIKMTLPIKYIMAEVGDIISFNGLINNMRAYGEAYTSLTTRNGQSIYPYFIITSVNRKEAQIQIECEQLHRLSSDFRAANGSVTRLVSQYDPPTYRNLDDFNQLMEFIDEDNKYFTREQKRVGDVLNDGFIDENDADEIINLTQNFIDSIAGDTNLDGQVDVTDIVATVNAVLGEYDESANQYFDLNDDGIVNVIDIVQLISIIMGEEE